MLLGNPGPHSSIPRMSRMSPEVPFSVVFAMFCTCWANISIAFEFAVATCSDYILDAPDVAQKHHTRPAEAHMEARCRPEASTKSPLGSQHDQLYAPMSLQEDQQTTMCAQSCSLGRYVGAINGQSDTQGSALEQLLRTTCVLGRKNCRLDSVLGSNLHSKDTKHT